MQKLEQSALIQPCYHRYLDNNPWSCMGRGRSRWLSYISKCRSILWVLNQIGWASERGGTHDGVIHWTSILEGSTRTLGHVQTFNCKKLLALLITHDYGRTHHIANNPEGPRDRWKKWLKLILSSALKRDPRRPLKRRLVFSYWVFRIVVHVYGQVHKGRPRSVKF